ncbi:hypothetical protein AA103196_2322 [Ameyamaea chiangmaiensis NBRC 103196]|uniref:HdeD family acid-resistance protein n=1 Tax=Ameyamaea chiangmaiensis TaxID=442969 RepID=A0A850P8U7_9PROT|nr:HdeD family acid-resistance protein [Ameyamaea chiangmaiensis]MBS4075419.1 HdeD family acid-resistance protein [Ameyamaea chiangmaiensis]NVN40328.1 HdeD family acid-resistance protein [Ameyamaea chiangmaiensis]GBQ69823.1 hypothetical protein AA103196_2322 [Ameyamaea chiangmaiensis NBRC 103196]
MPIPLAQRWGLFVALGVASIILGVIAWIDAINVSLASTVIIGGVLLVAGIVQIVHAFNVRDWAGFALSSMGGVLYGLCGILIMREPVAGSMIITAFIAAFLVIVGLSRIVIAATHRTLGGWWIILFGGLVSLLIGIMLYMTLPWSGLWLIGTFVGVELIVAGFSWIQIGLALRLTTRQP